MEDALYLNYINYKDDPNRGGVELFERKDMEYLPYFFLTFSSSTVPPLVVEGKIYDYMNLCVSKYNDSLLFEFGKKAVQSLNVRIEKRPEIAITRPNGNTNITNRSQYHILKSSNDMVMHRRKLTHSE